MKRSRTPRTTATLAFVLGASRQGGYKYLYDVRLPFDAESQHRSMATEGKSSYPIGEFALSFIFHNSRESKFCFIVWWSCLWAMTQHVNRPYNRSWCFSLLLFFRLNDSAAVWNELHESAQPSTKSSEEQNVWGSGLLEDMFSSHEKLPGRQSLQIVYEIL